MDPSPADKVAGSGQSSRSSSPSLSSARPKLGRSPQSNPNFSTLPPLVTTHPLRHSNSHRIASFVNKRLSTLSTNSTQIPRSRPQSNVFPAFHSSLPYTLVRDFAYPTTHPLHYGPPQEPSSATSATISDLGARRLSDPAATQQYHTPRGAWAGAPYSADASYGGPQLPATSFNDGPPWREDEDLLSPVVTSAKHRRTRSELMESDYFDAGNPQSPDGGRRTSYAGTNNDGSETYYVDHMSDSMAGGPGGEFIDVPASASSWHSATSGPGGSLPRGSYLEPHPYDIPSASPEFLDEDEESRFSKDYSFTIASPDEEMHGKAVALFDFERENENELPLVEGQVLWVSYRHGQGWLVAQDPKSGESGLVPEAYVRLVRDIQGGLNGLNGQAAMEGGSPITGPDTPTVPSSNQDAGGDNNNNNNTLHYFPVVSHFSTSSKDLHPYSLGSQANTPTSHSDTHVDRIPEEPETTSSDETEGQESQNESHVGRPGETKESDDVDDCDDDDDDDDGEQTEKVVRPKEPESVSVAATVR